MRRLLILTCCLINSLVVCCTARIHEVIPQKTTSYEYFSVKDGLAVAADPYCDSDRNIKYFGKYLDYNLLTEGILPVFIVFENLDGKDAFILVPELSNLSLIKKESGTRKEEILQEGHKKDLSVEINPVEWTFVTSLFGPIITIPYLGYYENKIAMSRNIQKKRLIIKTVYPGSSNNGFIYFRVPINTTVQNIHEIIIRVKNIRTNDLIDLPIKISK